MNSPSERVSEKELKHSVEYCRYTDVLLLRSSVPAVVRLDVDISFSLVGAVVIGDVAVESTMHKYQQIYLTESPHNLAYTLADWAASQPGSCQVDRHVKC